MKNGRILGCQRKFSQAGCNDPVLYRNGISASDYTYTCATPSRERMHRHLSREPPRLLVKIHLITEHYRAEGVMIAVLARNRNRSTRTGEDLAGTSRKSSFSALEILKIFRSPTRSSCELILASIQSFMGSRSNK